MRLKKKENPSKQRYTAYYSKTEITKKLKEIGEITSPLFKEGVDIAKIVRPGRSRESNWMKLNLIDFEELDIPQMKKIDDRIREILTRKESFNRIFKKKTIL